MAEDAHTEKYLGEKRRLPRNEAEARALVTLNQVRAFAKDLGCEKELNGDQKLKGWPAAFGNYHRGLWRWVWSLTPPEVDDLLNRAQLDAPETADDDETASVECVKKYEYLFWRAVFVAGMQIGEGFNSKHYAYYGKKARIATSIGDHEVSQLAAQRKWNAKKAKVQKGRTALERQTKFCLLTAWLAGGLWRMASREEQAKALKNYFPDFPPYSIEAITMAQKRFGLRWPI